MPTPPDLDYFDKVNYVIDAWVLPCEAPWYIYVSTSEVYGPALTFPMDEEHPLNPKSPYASSKAGGDRMVYSNVITYDIPAIILRPFNQYGPRQHLIKAVPRFVTGAISDELIRVHGDGSSTRDWVYVEDTCKALDMAMDAVESENLFEESMGGMADSAREWSKQLRKDLGLNEYEVRKNVATFNVMFDSMGISEDAAYDMATGMSQLAYDMASFYNLPTEEAFQKLQAGITGEAEPLKRLGILVCCMVN